MAHAMDTFENIEQVLGASLRPPDMNMLVVDPDLPNPIS